MRAAHRMGGSHRVGPSREGEVFIPERLLRIHRQVRAEVAGKKLEHRCIRPTRIIFGFWHFFGISLAFGTASTPKPFVTSSTAPQYKAGDITKVGCDIDTMLQAPFGSSPEQIEATSWYPPKLRLHRPPHGLARAHGPRRRHRAGCIRPRSTRGLERG